MGQRGLANLAPLSIERTQTEGTTFDALIDRFASEKARKRQF